MHLQKEQEQQQEQNIYRKNKNNKKEMPLTDMGMLTLACVLRRFGTVIPITTADMGEATSLD